MNPVLRLEHIANQHDSSVRRIQARLERADLRAQQAAQELAARARAERKRRAAARPAAGAPKPAELMQHPDLLIWALRSKPTK
ncbi:hypothetical protein ACFVMC_25020 [Nocardia sp. NPDC127579]|uniref:hypothetical protein n=1 Tax=Nocardia sp. NPDC127579 TaxID=3345402 RepID=UPI00363E03FD